MAHCLFDTFAGQYGSLETSCHTAEFSAGLLDGGAYGSTKNASKLLGSQQSALTARGPFSCSHCSKSFAMRGNLVRHERRHLSYKVMPCPFCTWQQIFYLEGSRLWNVSSFI